MSQLLSLCSRAWEPQPLSPCVATTELSALEPTCSATEEATAISLHTALKSSPCSLQLERSPHSDKGPVQPKKQKTELKKTKLQLQTSTLHSVTDKSSRQKASENRGGRRPSTDQTDIYITFHTTMAVLHSLLNYPQNTRKTN